nr:histone-lysine N-methyltransferase eggless isoform X2 [Halyomorpha halys]
MMEVSEVNDVVCVDESVSSPSAAAETPTTDSNETACVDNQEDEELLTLYKECFLKEPSYFVDLDKEKDCTKRSCINLQCDTGSDFVEPPRIARSYYCAPEGRNLAICKPCLKNVLGFYEDLLDKLRRGKPVSDAKFPAGTEVIIVDDDEEDMLQKELKEKQITGLEEIKEIAEEVKKALPSISLRYNIEGQMENNLNCLKSEMKQLEDTYRKYEDDINTTHESLFQSMRQLYDTYAPEREEMDELDLPYEEFKESPMKQLQIRPDENDLIITGYHPESGPPNLPPFGAVEKPKVKAFDKVYVMKVSAFSEWVPAVVEEVIPPSPENPKAVETYKVMINGGKPSAYRKDIGLQLIACYNAPPVRLPVGSRVISRYVNRLKNTVKFFSGMIAEMPSHINNFRYLIFFDDGQAQYGTHDSIRLVCESKANIWDHFNPKVQQFIKRYLVTFPERAMLKVKNLDCIKTEHKGMWVNARVVDIDCSLVHLVFLHDKHSEWLYRGSTRLYPMYIGLHRKGARSRGGPFVRRKGPYVQYDVVLSDDDNQNENTRPVRAVARKSSTRLPDSYDNERRLYDRRAASRFPPQQDDGVIEQRIPPKLVKPKPFRPHKCDSSCTDWLTTKEEDTKLLNPLVVPVLYAFSRETEVPTNAISYIAPCGRRLRNIVEVMNYLTETKLKLSLDLFDFDPWVNIFNEYVVSPDMVVMEDLSYGQETMPIACVNTINRSIPTYMDYMTKRRGSEGVYLNLEPGFLVSCDCTDNCQDKSKCACWQLTYAESQVFPPAAAKNLDQDSIGYQYKRLPNIINTAIYECNSGCKCCVKTCLNRVVQHPLKLKLQLFMTKNKGWGTRCLNDIPAGTFVCVYVGNIYTEAVANEDGKMYGDEYFAELDYIEVVEQSKEGYEDFVDPEEYLNNEKGSEVRNNSNNGNGRHSEDEFEPNVWISPSEYKKNSGMNLRKRSTRSINSDFSDSEEEDNYGLDDSDGEQQGPVNVDVSDNDSVSSLVRPSVRNFYGKDESVYIMDAKAAGNIGRYLNHSCDPNIFVQNVFVDTHDLRFPWVAFFALKYIPAGTELTWDYRYEVGSVPGKKMKCYCGSEYCRGRLL